jgi:hypothetical protein
MLEERYAATLHHAPQPPRDGYRIHWLSIRDSAI